MRINARLDDNHARKVETLRRMTHLTVSEIVKRAIDTYYEEVCHARPHPAEILAASGFLGSAQADADLSETYKERLDESWAAKHDHR